VGHVKVNASLTVSASQKSKDDSSFASPVGTRRPMVFLEEIVEEGLRVEMSSFLPFPTPPQQGGYSCRVRPSGGEVRLGVTLDPFSAGSRGGGSSAPRVGVLPRVT